MTQLLTPLALPQLPSSLTVGALYLTAEGKLAYFTGSETVEV